MGAASFAYLPSTRMGRFSPESIEAADVSFIVEAESPSDYP